MTSGKKCLQWACAIAGWASRRVAPRRQPGPRHLPGPRQPPALRLQPTLRLPRPRRNNNLEGTYIDNGTALRRPYLFSGANGRSPVAAAILGCSRSAGPGFQPGGLMWKRGHDTGSVCWPGGKLPPDMAGRMAAATDRWRDRIRQIIRANIFAIDRLILENSTRFGIRVIPYEGHHQGTIVVCACRHLRYRLCFFNPSRPARDRAGNFLCAASRR